MTFLFKKYKLWTKRCLTKCEGSSSFPCSSIFSLLSFFTTSMFTLLYLNSPRYDISLFNYLHHSIWTTYRKNIKYQLTLYYITSILQTHTHTCIYLYMYTQYASYIHPYQLVFSCILWCRHVVSDARKRVAKFHWSLVPLLNVGGPEESMAWRWTWETPGVGELSKDVF